jgi:hypothetical protein
MKQSTLNRRASSVTQKNFEDLEQKSFEKISERIDEKIQEQIKILKLDGIAHMIEINNKTISNSINNSLESHKYLCEEHEQNWNAKYEKLREKYLNLQQTYRESINKNQEIISNYQGILAKLCSTILLQRNAINSEEFNALNFAREELLDMPTSAREVKETFERSKVIPPNQSRIQNPVIRNNRNFSSNILDDDE